MIEALAAFLAVLAPFLVLVTYRQRQEIGRLRAAAEPPCYGEHAPLANQPRPLGPGGATCQVCGEELP